MEDFTARMHEKMLHRGSSAIQNSRKKQDRNDNYTNTLPEHSVQHAGTAQCQLYLTVYGCPYADTVIWCVRDDCNDLDSVINLC